ncbi:hypothetical protein GUJ93_ZPchr0010g7297 [Zizania palustris]|uniref:Methyltransferase n=1 Tax=Zizania palustris TaxID=103762 RepID=A0A8J6BIL1_ZIZPA|nr:hypothetical protein GUJ93_ZPchr0010g7297 [Zizania palustris]
MAVPSDLRKRLSLFLLLSALLVVVFLFLDPSARTLSVLSSRLTAPSSLAPPAAPRQQNPTPTPTPGNTQPRASAAVDAKPEESTDASAKAEESASRPDAIAGAGGDIGNSELPRVDDGSDADGVEGKARTGAADAEGVVDGDGGGDEAAAEVRWETCRVGRGVSAADYIPCLDNVKAIKKLRSRRQMEHRERHCPAPPPRCLVRLPRGYRPPVPWPRSRDMIWYNNVPHPKLVEYKKDQNWVTKSDDYLVFPGGGTQFKAGVTRYIQFIEQVMPAIQWGTHTRTVLDVGCGVASFGGYLLDRNAITMSFAPKDEHEAQIQFALERGIPAFLAVIGTQKLPFPDEAFDVVHCARCRVHWYANGGKPLLELNRVLRPGGFYIWSATPVYRQEKRDQDDWNAMVTLTKSICWRTVVKSQDSNGIGVVIYQKLTSSSCYLERKTNKPPMCSEKDGPRFPWYIYSSSFSFLFLHCCFISQMHLIL